MKIHIRVIYQIIFWFLVTIIMGLERSNFLEFFVRNSIAFFSQIGLVVFLTYYMMPKWFFKKKYLTFGVALFVIIFVLIHIVSNAIAFHPPQGRPGMPPLMFIGPSALFINFLLLSLTCVLCIIIEVFIDTRLKEEALVLSKSQNVESELKFLKSQINPHFLFNSLNNIYALAGIDSEKTQFAISYLSNLLRYVIYDCDKQKVSLDKEIHYIYNFIKLFQLKSSKIYPIETEFEVENKLVEIAPMVLIPFVENAFKHSNIGNHKNSFIHISIKTENDKIVFFIANSKPNIELVKDETGGVGIVNVKKRLELTYPNRHLLTITETETKYEVALTISNYV